MPLFVFDPRLWGPAGATRRAYLVASLDALPERIGGLVVRRGDPVDVLPTVVRRGRGVPACTSPRTSARTVESATRASRTALAELERRAGPDRVAVRRLAGRVRNQSGDGYQVFTPFCEGLARPRLAGAGAHAGRRRWDTSLPSDAMLEATAPKGLALPTAGEAAARRHWKAYVERPPGGLRRAPRPARPRRHLAHVGAPEVGRDPPAHDAGRSPARAARARRSRRTAPSWRGASSTPTCWRAVPRRRASTTGRSSPR